MASCTISLLSLLLVGYAENAHFLEGRGYGGSAFWNSPKPIYQGPDCEWPVLKSQELEAQQKSQAADGGISNSPIADMIRNPKQTLERLVSSD